MIDWNAILLDCDKLDNKLQQSNNYNDLSLKKVLLHQFVLESLRIILLQVTVNVFTGMTVN